MRRNRQHLPGTALIIGVLSCATTAFILTSINPTISYRPKSLGILSSVATVIFKIACRILNIREPGNLPSVLLCHMFLFAAFAKAFTRLSEQEPNNPIPAASSI